MKIVELIKTKDCLDLINTTPNKNHYSTVINENCVIKKNGEIKGIYYKIDKKTIDEIKEIVKTTKFIDSHRTKKAITTRSSVFGFLPRNPMRQDYCRISESSKKERNNFFKLYDFSKKLIEIYKQHLPEKYQKDISIISSSIKKEWMLDEEIPFTTISLNVNHAIKYHLDTANYKNNFSNVLICSDGIKGGELVLPEYEIALSQENGFLLIFDGQNEIHGVMPIIPLKKDFFRASLVYYALENMKHCYPFKEEVKRIKIKDTERAKKRVLNIDPRAK
jgi:hypothetical protein